MKGQEMAFYHRMVQPIDKTQPTEELLCAALMADLSYVPDEQVLLNTMAVYLGTGNFARYETASALACNYVMTVQEDGIIIAFSGTENYAEFLYYACTGFNLSTSQLDAARVHVGFFNIAMEVLTDLEMRISPSMKFAPMTLIGHSLGGAVAQILGAWFKIRPGYDVQNIVTFGCPAVGDFDFQRLIENVNKISVTNQGDPVPYLPLEVGVKWRVAGTTPLRFGLYHFTPIFPWLLSTNDGAYIQREGHFANLPRALVEAVWKLLRDPNDTERVVDGKEFESHFITFYCSRMLQWMKRSGQPFSSSFYDLMFSAIDNLIFAGQGVQEIPQADFNRLVASFGMSQGLVAQPALPDDPYLAFYAWCAGTRSDIKLEIGIYTNVLPRDEVRIQDLVEANFPGYRRATDDTWAKKDAINNVAASAQSALCTWVQNRPGPQQIARGIFVIMRDGSRQTLIGAANFQRPVGFGHIDDKISGYAQVVAILSQVTGTAQKTAADIPGLYSFSYAFVSQVGATGSRTNFNGNVIFPNPFAVTFDLSQAVATGSPRVWWEFRGEDRRIIETLLNTLRAIQKRDASMLGVQNPPPPILGTVEDPIENAVQTLVNHLAFDLMVVHG